MRRDNNFPFEAIEAIKEVLEVGRKQGYPPGNWRTETYTRHIGKAVGHIGKFLVSFEPAHLKHALTRMALAWGVYYHLYRGE